MNTEPDQSDARFVERTSALGVAYTSRGEGDPVVLLHGWCLNGRLWEIQEEALLGRHQVVCVDLAGFGRSRGLTGPYDISRHAADVAEILEELRVQDAVVGGFAYGGAVALELAATRPQRLKRMVVVGIPSGSTAPYDRMPRAMRRDWPDFARRSAEAICKQPQSAARIDALGRMFGDTPLPVALETVAVLGAFDPVPLAARVPVPTTFLHGAQDDVVPVAVAEACVAEMSDAQLVVVPDSGHLVLLDQPTAVSDALGG
jgi:pimeloyl-ACP methyl ester carboxylesterase